MAISIRCLWLVSLISLAIACGGDSANNPLTSPTTIVTGTAPYSTVDIVVGSGDEAVSGKQVIVGYTVWLYSDTAPGNLGNQLDSSYNAGRVPYAFSVGAGTVIRGLDQGVVGMHGGGTRLIVIPPDLAYGATGTSVIPPNATLVFQVDLLAVS